MSTRKRSGNRRWGSAARIDDKDHARGELVSAAIRCFERVGVSQARMEDIAREAAVTRATVYQYFPDRDSILTAAVLERTRTLTSEVRDIFETTASLKIGVVDASLTSAHVVRQNRFLRHIFIEGGLEAFHATVTSDDWRDLGHQIIEPLLARAVDSAEVSPTATADDVLMLLVILTAGLLFATGETDEASARQALTRLLGDD